MEITLGKLFTTAERGIRSTAESLHKIQRNLAMERAASQAHNASHQAWQSLGGRTGELVSLDAVEKVLSLELSAAHYVVEQQVRRYGPNYDSSLLPTLMVAQDLSTPVGREAAVAVFRSARDRVSVVMDAFKETPPKHPMIQKYRGRQTAYNKAIQLLSA